MWPQRRLIELLQIEHPLILAPMGGIGTVELAASVSAGGGLGSIACALQHPEAASKAIHELKAVTDRPINANCFCHCLPRHGGEFVLTEQRPRKQSRPEIVPLKQGDAVAFAVHHRPVEGVRGTYRVKLRHGVSRLRSGR
jgi:NAD(P)H-dependent flavin oxidoreductase YrpB (nitropropane dioxygenase family)